MPSDGHVFVVSGDLRRLVCDAWLLPTDLRLAIEPPWLRPPPDPAPATHEWFGRFITAVMSAEDPFRGALVHGLTTARSPSGALPVLGATAVSRDFVDDRHVDRVLREFVELGRQHAAELRSEGVGGTRAPAERRRRPLLAVPALGTGQGGGSTVRGAVLQSLLHRLAGLADGVDIALVIRRPAAAAALRAHRRTPEHLGEFFDELGPELVAAARSLADRVRRGEVVLFTGAGISVPAGLPDWESLLRTISAPGLFDDPELGRLSALDKASIVERNLAAAAGGSATQGRAALVSAVAAAVSVDHYALGHALLANLPVGEAATLNYDELLERAAADAGRPLAVLPYVRPGPQYAGWLLKLHGCVRPERRDDIVLTRADYLSLSGHRAALTGLLQAMLVTRHMLFVGFGLGDEHFHAVVHDVRRALAGASGASTSRIGTALMLRQQKSAELIWDNDLDLIAMSGEDPARRLEIFLDLLANESDQGWQHVLDDSFGSILDDTLRTLRDRLTDLVALRPVLEGGGAWPGVVAMLRQFGYEADLPDEQR